MATTSQTEANRALLQREREELTLAKNVDAVDDLYADHVTVRMTRSGTDETVVDREDLKALYREWFGAFPDLTEEVHARVAEGDEVMEYLTIRGTHEGPFRGIEPTGAEIEADGYHYRRIEDGRIVETASMVGMTTVYQQLGVDLPVE
ncbi:ester cyclase [Halomarina oriensis]|uniref:Ester cyclase n=1 Tax=Halomarina oriensis TaxID=671145 RepID=A0A6B0GRL1_9EURY|nr:ester cyclase [Halomarina oriensis]MWG36771.1 hypothetical protein [Halomarina oriensis]